MKPRKTSAKDRYANSLHEIIEGTARDLRMPEDQQQATREAVIGHLSQLNRKTLVDTLMKLYRQAEKDAQERAKRVNGNRQ